MSSTGRAWSPFCASVIIEVAREHYDRGTCCEISSTVKFGYVTLRHTDTCLYSSWASWAEKTTWLLFELISETVD